MIDYSLILATNYAGKDWTLIGNAYEGLEWKDISSKPTQSELDSQWTSIKATILTFDQIKQNKASALAKLSALGLTQDEVKALVG